MKQQQNLLSHLRDYLRALGESGRIITILITLLGIVPTIFFYLGVLTIPGTWLAVWLVVIFVLAFGVANFLVFEGHRSKRLEFYPLEEKSSANLLDSWISVSSNGLAITGKLKVAFTTLFDVYNPVESPTSIKLTINSIDSNWKISANPDDIKFKFDGNRAESNDLRLGGFENREVRADFTIAFDGPDDKLDFGYLGSLSKIVVGFVIEQRNYKARNLSVPFDVTQIHKKAEEQLMKQGLNLVIKPMDSRRVDLYRLDQDQILTLLNNLKEYWHVNK